jgi:hypothetical protein
VRASRRTFLIAAAAGVAVVLVALVLLAVFAGGHARRPHLVLARSSPATSNPLDSTSGTAGAPLPIPADDARAVVVRYLDDINTQNRADATTLICSALVDDWKAKIDEPGGDFTVAVTRAVFHGATPAPGGDALSYQLDVRPRTGEEVNSSPITFTVTGSAGAYQLCGER